MTLVEYIYNEDTATCMFKLWCWLFCSFCNDN